MRVWLFAPPLLLHAYVLSQCAHYPELRTALLWLSFPVFALSLVATRLLRSALPSAESEVEENLRWIPRALRSVRWAHR